MKTYKFQITGRQISKKNNKVVATKNGRNFIFSSKPFQKFEKSAIKQLRQQLSQHGIIEALNGDLTVEYSFYIKGKYNQDICNAITSINDILEDAEVIYNDSMINRVTATKKRGCKDFYTDIIIRVNEGKKDV